MVAYIKQLLTDLLKVAGARNPDVFCLMNAVTREINRLDPRDFEPAVRKDFAHIRARMEWASGDVARMQWVFAELGTLLTVLDHYVGENSRATVRQFPFIADNELRAIVIRDYCELIQIVFPSHAWKSTVILAGSILEALLFDQLTRDGGRIEAATGSAIAPHKKNLLKGEWSLQDMINVSVNIGILTEERADCIDQVLRDYRNFVHPNKEIKAQHPCSEAEAFLARGALDAVCNHLEGVK